MVLTFVLFMATVYSGYVGEPLYCDRGNGLVYGEPSFPRVALPASQHGITWECGDLVYFSGTDVNGEPWSLLARAQDAGPLAGYCVEVGMECISIGVDVQEPFAPFPGLSARVERFMNFSAEARKSRVGGRSTDVVVGRTSVNERNQR